MVAYPIYQCIYICTLFASNSESSSTYELQSVQRCLQDFVGPIPVIKMESFTHWAKLISYDHVFVINPVSADEVQRSVLAAQYCNVQIRVIGGAYSTPPLYGGRGQIHLDLSDMCLEDGRRVVLRAEDPNNPYATVRVAAGLTQEELDKELDSLNYAFPFGPIIKDITIGGALATSSHGSLYDSSSIGAYMMGARLVDGRGNIQDFYEGNDPEIMKALRCNLGLLGILLHVELKVIPQQRVTLENIFTPLKNFFNPNFLRQVVSGNYYVNLIHDPYNSITEEEARVVSETGMVPETWNSGNDLVLVQLVNPVSRPSRVPFKDARPSSYNVTVVTEGQELFRFRLGLPPHQVLKLYEAVHVPTTAVSVSLLTEYIFPDLDFTAGSLAIQTMSSILDHDSYVEGIQPVKATLCRWVRGTLCHLCPASHPSAAGGPLPPVDRNQTYDQPYDHDHADDHDQIAVAGTGDIFATINIQSKSATDSELQLSKSHFSKVFRTFDQLGLNGRLHWGKDLVDSVPDLRRRMQSVYGGDLEAFLKVRRSLDPDGVFTNSFLRSLFGIQKCGDQL